jgi:hypothetical protein
LNKQADLALGMVGYDAVLDACERLAEALFSQAPIARQMHLLSSNGACSAARAGLDGQPFRVLTEAIEHLGKDVVTCINESKMIVENSVTLASNLVAVLPRLGCIDEYAKVEEQTALIHLVYEQNRQLAHSLRQLDLALSPMEMLVKKGEYLALFSSVEAGNSVKDGARFELIASRLKATVSALNEHQKQQRGLLNELLLSVEQQHIDLRTAVKAA